MKKSMWVLLFCVLATGCASSTQYTRDIGILQSQVTALSNDMARVDGQSRYAIDLATKNQADIILLQAKKIQSTSPAEEVSYTDGAMYRTPSGFEVKSVDIQKALQGAGYYSGNIDGKIGPQTREALRAFQRDHHMTADGVCGPKTWDALSQYLTSVDHGK